MTEFSAHQFRETAKEALAVSSTYIRDVILGNVDLSHYLTKGDKTAVTMIDKKSQELAKPIILRDLSNYRLNQEESNEEEGNFNSRIVIYHDPLDGTGGFLMGAPTPSVILAAYDSVKKQVLAVGTMEPTTGRLWFSANGEGAWLNRFDYQTEKWLSTDGEPIRVNQQDIQGSHVLVDVSHPFSRLGGTKPILYTGGCRALTTSLESKGAKVASFYTNGGHYALVASGRPTLVGNITTAIGGPFDVAGLLHVVEAGGVAQCYEISNKDGLRNLQWLSKTQDIELADIVIAANNPQNLEHLKTATQVAVGYRM
jgi:fructose-1,6-bisphosphatase/inositol monophosphatase family enzyme